MARKQLLTPAEWHVMECLWKKSPRSGREASEYLKEHMDWSRSTTLTMLRRMWEKGTLACENLNGVKVYMPLVEREQAAKSVTAEFLHRVHRDDPVALLTVLVNDPAVTDEQLQQMADVLATAKANRG